MKVVKMVLSKMNKIKEGGGGVDMVLQLASLKEPSMVHAQTVCWILSDNLDLVPQRPIWHLQSLPSLLSVRCQAGQEAERDCTQAYNKNHSTNF